MRLSDLKPCEVLGEFLKNNISDKVYISDKPSSNLADVYVAHIVTGKQIGRAHV